MTVFQKAASFAAIGLSLVGLCGFGTPVLAHPLIAEGVGAVGLSYATSLINTNDTLPVPSNNSAEDKSEVAPIALPDAPVQTDFESLADAVAAQDAVAGDDTVRCLAGAIYFEARGEPLSGQYAVAQVILNRAKSARFPTDICSVVTQRGQFSFVRDGEIPAVDANRATYRRAVAVAKTALTDSWSKSPAQTALYFNTPGNRPSARLTKLAAIGNHIFYR